MYSSFYHLKFPGVLAEVVKKYQVCQRHKGRIDKRYPVYYRNVREPYEMVAVDLIQFSKSKRWYKYVLVTIDLCSKYVYAVPLITKWSAPVARALESGLLAPAHYTEKAILSENELVFRGKPFESLLATYGIHHEYSVPYAVCTNGNVEYLNEMISQYNRIPH